MIATLRTLLMAVRLWRNATRRWTCTLPDRTGFPCGTRGHGAAAQQQHDAEHRAGLTGRYVCGTCHTRHTTSEAADRCGGTA